jgi:hypothetical protein
MSPREQLANDISEYLENCNCTAPYGVLSGIESTKSGGKCRVVTFGLARSLDATIRIYSVDRIALRHSRSRYGKDEVFKNTADLYSYLEKEFGIKPTI